MNSKFFKKNKTGQSLVSTIVGVVLLGVIGMVGVQLNQTALKAQNLSDKDADKIALFENVANDVKNTRFHQIEEKYSNKLFVDLSDKYDVKTKTSKVCKNDNNNRCVFKQVDIKICQKGSACNNTDNGLLYEDMIYRAYTSYADIYRYTSPSVFNLELPEDLIGFNYEVKGSNGGNGGNASVTTHHLVQHSRQVCVTVPDPPPDPTPDPTPTPEPEPPKETRTYNYYTFWRRYPAAGYYDSCPNSGYSAGCYWFYYSDIFMSSAKVDFSHDYGAGPWFTVYGTALRNITVNGASYKKGSSFSFTVYSPGIDTVTITG